MILDIEFLRESLDGGMISFGGEKAVPINDCNKVSPSMAELFLKKSGFEGRDFSVSIDTRTIDAASGDDKIFLALRGNSVDGHNFLRDAVEKNIFVFIVEELQKEHFGPLLEKCLVIVVPDTLSALINMAKMWRKRFLYPVVGVTGSVGKTTTKEMIRSILDFNGVPSCVSYKNQNTLVGLSLNILRMRDDHKVAIFEVGISQKGEMDEKVDLLMPTIGVITTVAHAHMDGLGPLPEICKEKKKLFKHFKSDNIGIIYGDNDLLGKASYPHPVIRFGTQTKNHVQARKISHSQHISFTLKLYNESKKISLETSHVGNVYNALAAAAVVNLLDVFPKRGKSKISRIVGGLELFAGFEERFEKRLLRDGDGFLISDCYNANPASMRAAILSFHEMGYFSQKVAILGDMLELGEKELFWHRQIGRVLSKAMSIKHVILVGNRAKSIGKTAPLNLKIDYANDWREAELKLKKILKSDSKKQNSLVLVKASHGMELHNLVDHVSERSV